MALSTETTNAVGRLEVQWATENSMCIMWQGREILIGAGANALTMQLHAPASDWVMVADHHRDTQPKRVATILVNVK